MVRSAERKEGFMEKHQYAVGDRVEKVCTVCGEERGHVVASVTKRGHVSRVSCVQCGMRSAFKGSVSTPEGGTAAPDSPPYDWTHTYHKGQTMLHPTFGLGEVTAVIEPRKIDVLFSDRLRRLIHARTQA
jgi:hypothetical protein